jgi:hypothetical protein
VRARDRPIAARGTERSTDVDAFKPASLTQREQFYSDVLKDLLESDLPFMIRRVRRKSLYPRAVPDKGPRHFYDCHGISPPALSSTAEQSGIGG